MVAPADPVLVSVTVRFALLPTGTFPKAMLDTVVETVPVVLATAPDPYAESGQ